MTQTHTHNTTDTQPAVVVYQFAIEVRTPKAHIRTTAHHKNALDALDAISIKYPNATQISVQHTTTSG